MTATLETPLCDLLGCDYPVALAGMGGVARAELVAAVSEAGGFGFLGMVRESPALIRAEIAAVRAATTRDFGVNLIPAATPPELFAAEIETVIAERVAAVALFWDFEPGLVGRLRAAGSIVVCQIGSAAEAAAAAAAGAQVLIAQGVEAGGHVRGKTPLATLLPEVVACTGLPVLAAGGISDGAGLAAALAQGAQGVLIGTAFLATKESFAHSYHKERILAARPDETVLSRAFHINWPAGAAVRVLPNSVTDGAKGDPWLRPRRIIGEEHGRPIYLFSTDSPLRDMTGDFEAMALYAGDGAGRIGDIPSAAERLKRMIEEARRIIGSVPTALPEESTAAVPSSPVCYAAEAEDAYMGYATREEIGGFLNLLLEAARAQARLALRSALATHDPSLAAALQSMHEDAARWCRVLRGRTLALGLPATPKIGAAYREAMATETLGERLGILRRGQDGIIAALRQMLPRVHDDALHAELATMLRSQETALSRGDRLAPRVMPPSSG